MILTLLSLLSTDADACRPEIATVYDVVPSDQSMEVPVDSILKIEMGAGYLQGTPEISLRQGMKTLEVDLEIYTRTIDLIEEHIVLEVTPLDELEPSLEYTLEMVDEYSGESEVLSTFVVMEKRSEEVAEAPSLTWIEHTFYEISEAEMNSCHYENSTNLYFDFGNGEGLSSRSITIYRVNADLVYSGVEIEEEHLNERFHTVLKHGEYSTLSTKITGTSYDEEYCFVARYSNEAGQEGPLSSPVCSMNYDDMHWECGTVMGPLGWFGCSSIGPSTTGLFAMMMSVFGLVRRRKE